VSALIQRIENAIQAPARWFNRCAEHTQDRIIGGILFLPSATVLAIATSLTPDASGLGTHRQLGLGGCTILTMTGVPCPMCGMTTTFTHLAHLQIVPGFINQPFGLVLFTLTVMAFVIGAMDLTRPGRRWHRVLAWVDRREAIVAYGLLGGMILGWGYKVALVNQLLPWIGRG
jgi:hypothetical protein